MSDISAALLSEQLEHLAQITKARLEIWNAYDAALRPLRDAGLLELATIPPGACHNAHLYRVMVRDARERDHLIAALAGNGISAYFHYVPLHCAPASGRLGRVHGPMDVTDDAARRIVRMRCGSAWATGRWLASWMRCTTRWRPARSRRRAPKRSRDLRPARHPIASASQAVAFDAWRLWWIPTSGPAAPCC